MFRLGLWEILLILLLLVLLIWAPRRLPELGKALGEFWANLKKTRSGEEPAPRNGGDEEKKP